MGMGKLKVSVYADNIGQPVEGANVEITGNNITMRLTTDSSGQTDFVNLPSIDKKYSLTPQTKVKPYTTYNVKVVKSGLQTKVIKGVEILDGTTSFQDIIMNSAQLRNPPEEIITIPEHVLWGNYPPKVAVDPISQIPLETPGDVLPFPLVPEYVLVRDGLPTDSTAANYDVPFIDYIKNVSSSEIYATWPLETLKANIYAILSFTMNRIYSEWYRSKGYSFTITSSTQFDQKFIYGRNIFMEISQVVDSIFQEYIQRGNLPQPFFAQYCDGVRVINAGWLSQWGSKDLGDRGYIAIDILKYYYGSDISIQTADVIEGMPNSFPGFNLSLNTCGDAVQKLQAEMNIIASSYPSIPKIYPVDGKYGENTQTSVQTFQRIFNMPVTGIVDFATWYRISLIYVGVSKMLQGRYT